MKKSRFLPMVPTPILSPPQGTTTRELSNMDEEGDADEGTSDKAKLATVDKLRARVWLMEEELMISEKAR